jgi:hypothetical protein
LLGCFSKRINLLAQKDGSPNSPLALYHNVDFDIAGVAYALEEPYDSEYRAGKLDNAGVMALMKKYNNVAREWRIELRVVKDVLTSMRSTICQRITCATPPCYFE